MKTFYTAILSLMLGGLALAQPSFPILPSLPSLQVQGHHGSLNLGFAADGQPVVEAAGAWVARPEATFHGRNWNNATLSHGAQGELILSDPNHGNITMERGPMGKTYIQTRDGNITVDHSVLQQLIQGQDPVLMQLQGW